MSVNSVPGRLSNQAVLAVWEDGSRQGPVDRALAMLQVALPEGDAHDLDAWPIGRRDGALLDLRAATFGPRIAGLIACPACAEELDLAFEVSDVRGPGTGLDDPLSLTAGDPPCRIVFRLPTSVDLRAAARAEDVEQGRRILAEHCLLSAERAGEPIPMEAVQNELIERMEELMALHDPQSAIDLSLTCPACGHAWRAGFDIADFLWREISAQARLLVNDVHALALAYGWREEDILSMPEGRRQMYLDLVL